jgi:DNA-binding response OmpR family regulator
MHKSKVNSKRIVVVEDDPDILNVIDIMLSLKGYDIEALSNGSLIMQSEIAIPDLYILDKMLPDYDGTSICSFLKSQEATRGIPVIMISANCMTKNLAMKVGATTFIEKPLRMTNFLNAVANALLVT